MDNPSYKPHVEERGEVPFSSPFPRPSNGQPAVHKGVSGTRTQKKAKNPCSQLRQKSKKHMSKVQKNSITGSCFPPRNEVAAPLTLLFTIVAIFLTARTVLGPIADIGGTIFALLMLILVALLGGKLVLMIGWVMHKTCKVDVMLPPLLGMLIVGIMLKNIPYNFGQFGRAECTAGHMNASLLNMTFVDSSHELDRPEDHGSWKRSVEDWPEVQALNHAKQSLELNNTEDLNCHPKYIGHDLDPAISRSLRSICLTVILLMAGLELDPVALMKLSAMVVRATFIPCFVEAVAVAVLSNLLLGFPWTVGFMLGFVLAAVSPAVIIPSLMSLSQRGYGVVKGIPTLVIAACSADDVVAISGFGIFLGLTFSKGAPLWKLILHGPIEVVIGVSFGIFWGFLAQWFPNKDHRHVAFFRWLILLCGGLSAVFGAHLIHYDGAGGLATIIMAFVAGMQWRKEGWGDHNPVMKTFKQMWIILEPIIFALIGTEIQIDKINPNTLGLSIVVLLVALVFRMAATYIAVSGGELNVKEKIFMAFAWLPKATVQAALGPIFLDMVLKLKDEDWQALGNKDIWLGMGNDILTLAVLSILITAPLGAVSIIALGPKLLTRDAPEDQEEKREGPAKAWGNFHG